jgi:hypothetical protein
LDIATIDVSIDTYPAVDRFGQTTFVVVASGGLNWETEKSVAERIDLLRARDQDVSKDGV